MKIAFHSRIWVGKDVVQWFHSQDFSICKSCNPGSSLEGREQYIGNSSAKSPVALI